MLDVKLKLISEAAYNDKGDGRVSVGVEKVGTIISEVLDCNSISSKIIWTYTNL